MSDQKRDDQMANLLVQRLWFLVQANSRAYDPKEGKCLDFLFLTGWRRGPASNPEPIEADPGWAQRARTPLLTDTSWRDGVHSGPHPKSRGRVRRATRASNPIGTKPLVVFHFVLFIRIEV